MVKAIQLPVSIDNELALTSEIYDIDRNTINTSSHRFYLKVLLKTQVAYNYVQTCLSDKLFIG